MKYYILLLFMLISVSTADAVSTGKIKVEVLNIQSYSGSIQIKLYNSEENYKNASANPYKCKIIKADGNQTQVTFDDLPYGKYAVVILHDVNNNGKLDKNFIGKPTEPYAFSRNFKPNNKKPDFDDISFDLDADFLRCNVKLQ